MEYTKQPTSIEDQITLLQSRGMEGCLNLMKLWLETVGYYRLSAYWLPYEQPTQADQTRSKKFNVGTNFSSIVDIYVFDRKLRLLTTEAIERIEIALRARWTNRTTIAYGPHAQLNVGAFCFDLAHTRLLANMANRIDESKEVSVQHYRAKYTAPKLPPLWVTSELMTFGELSKWFSITDDTSLKTKIAKDLGLPTKEALEGTVQLLSYVRNICAHHGRLWNRQTVKRLPQIKKYKESLDIHVQGQQRQPSNKIYNVLSILIILLEYQSPQTTYRQRVKNLLEERTLDQLVMMGFPLDWQARPCWR